MLTARYGAGDEIKQDWRNLEGMFFFEFCCSDMLGKEFRNQMKSRPHLVPPRLVALFLAERCTTSGTKNLLCYSGFLSYNIRRGLASPFIVVAAAKTHGRPPGGGVGEGRDHFLEGRKHTQKLKKMLFFVYIDVESVSTCSRYFFILFYSDFF